jgi:20S proteasome alpha/beta subunit
VYKFLSAFNIIFSIYPQDGVILGADTRATEGPIVCDKNCEKIHYMAPNIYCCGAGTAADTEAVTGIFLVVFLKKIRHVVVYDASTTNSYPTTSSQFL